MSNTIKGQFSGFHATYRNSATGKSRKVWIRNEGTSKNTGEKIYLVQFAHYYGVTGGNKTVYSYSEPKWLKASSIIIPAWKRKEIEVVA